MDEKPKRRWFQFTLRTLFVLVLVFSIPLAWLANERRAIAERRTALMNATLGDVQPQPTWRLWLLGDDSPGYSESINFEYPHVTDTDLVQLKGLTQLKKLTLNSSEITDAGLVHLKGLTQLKILTLNRSKVTDAGLLHLKGLTQLEVLLLRNTQVTDAGLVHLKGFTQLKTLWLRNTQVTDVGQNELEIALPNTAIHR